VLVHGGGGRRDVERGRPFGATLVALLDHLEDLLAGGIRQLDLHDEFVVLRSGSGPPFQLTSRSPMEMVQPAFGIGLARAIESGRITVMPLVALPSQPWPTRKVSF
jgi:hypothetical protein